MLSQGVRFSITKGLANVSSTSRRSVSGEIKLSFKRINSVTRSFTEGCDGGLNNCDLVGRGMTKNKEIVCKEKVSERDSAPTQLDRFPSPVFNSKRNSLRETLHA